MSANSHKIIPSNMIMSFKKIVDFVNSLTDSLGEEEKNHSLVLYNHLLSKTTITHRQAIEKHLSLFKDFCFRNEASIYAKDSTKMIQDKVSYSDKVYINIGDIIRTSDSEIANQIWNHLLVIYASIDPDSNARHMLAEMSAQGTGTGTSNEDNFLNNCIKQISSAAQSNGDDLSGSMNEIMSSGLMGNLVTSINQGVKGGQLDLGKLMSSVGGMLGSMNQADKLGTPGGMDLSGIMQMMGPMMAAMGGTQGLNISSTGQLEGLNPDNVKADIQKQVEEEVQRLNNSDTKPSTSLASQTTSSVSSLESLD